MVNVRSGEVLDKVVAGPAEAVADVPPGASIAVGGFGLVGVPDALIAALLERGVGDLTTVSNNCGLDGSGLGLLLGAHRIRKHIGSYIGDNAEFARQFLAGEVEVELTPQGSLAERLRAGGAGIPAFYTPAGVGTLIEQGGLPIRYAPDGAVSIHSTPRETREFDGRTYLLEHAITTDFALVHAWKGDAAGNLVFRRTAQNFNPLVAAAGRITIAEVEHLVEPGEITPREVHTPGVYVQRVVHVPGSGRDKRIEKLTLLSDEVK
jgi:3-oxoacid CoA-transferase subunit A